jgi:antitoxin component HigA of HigAB toxin-antitoxin module
MTNIELLTNTWKNVAHVINLSRPNNELEYDQLIELIEHLLEKAGPNPASSPYSMLIDTAMTYAHDWETTHTPMPEGSPTNVLIALMDAHELSQADLVRAGIADQPTLSRILNGERSISKNIAARLATHFNVSAALFL